MGNKISRTETIETNDDNGTKGGVEDTADDRDRYGENKCLAPPWILSLRRVAEGGGILE